MTRRLCSYRPTEPAWPVGKTSAPHGRDRRAARLILTEIDQTSRMSTARVLVGVTTTQEHS